MLLEVGFGVAHALALAAWREAGEEAGHAEDGGEEGVDFGGGVGLCLDFFAADSGGPGAEGGRVEEGGVLGEGDADFAREVGG